MAQLGADSGVNVRVRRVNPPEDHRAMLRAGELAPPRMDTPMSLVTILRRRLPDEEPQVIVPPQPVQTAIPAALLVETPPPSIAAPRETAPEPSPDPEVAVAEPVQPIADTAPKPASMTGGFFVQAAAFSTQERADLAASALDGHVIPGGRFFRVRTGPFATRKEAAASLAKVRAAGYDDARILTGG